MRTTKIYMNKIKWTGSCNDPKVKTIGLQLEDSERSQAEKRESSFVLFRNLSFSFNES